MGLVHHSHYQEEEQEKGLEGFAGKALFFLGVFFPSASPKNHTGQSP